jgi:drug/metabolite transporter (DMT)-like permease
MIFAMIGCAFILADPQALRKADLSGSTLLPNVINLISAFFGALYFLMNAKNVNSMPIVSLVLFQNIHLFFINSLLAKYSNPDIEIFSFDMNTGCLGFFDPRIAFIAFIPFGIFCSIMGSAGYVICLLFYSPLVVSNAYLIEPFIA